jgi:hypothetical protein
VAIGRSDFSIIITTIQGDILESSKIVETIPHKADETLEHMFLDVSGQHLIATTSSGDSIYLNTFSLKHAKISRLQGSIESVAFGRDVENDMGHRSFLVGTTAGTYVNTRRLNNTLKYSIFYVQVFTNIYYILVLFTSFTFSTGAIYELIIDAYDREKSCQLVFQLSQPLAITSLFYDYLGQSVSV